MINLIHNKHYQISFIKINNEASLSIQYELSNNDIKFQLVPPNNYRANAAKRAIHIFKKSLY